MRKFLLSLFAAAGILTANAQNDYLKLTDGRGIRCIVTIDETAGAITYKMDDRSPENKVDLSEVAFVEREKEGIICFRYDSAAQDINSPELQKRSAENPFSLIAKGSKVYIPISSELYHCTLGRFNMRKELTTNYKLWTVVDTPWEAEFILEFIFDAKGRDTCYFVLKTRSGQEFYRSKEYKTINPNNSFKFTVMDPRISSVHTVAKLCKKEMPKLQN